MFNRLKWVFYIVSFICSIILLLLLLIALTSYFKSRYTFNLSDTLAFAQLVLSIILLPTVIFGFVITFQSFRASQDQPDIDLFLETESGVHEKSIKFDSSEILKPRAERTDHPIETERPFGLVIINTGNAIALWYAIHITFQFDEAYSDRYLNWTQFYKMIVGQHWQINHEERGKNKRFDGMFMSEGSLALYPNMPIKICE